MKMRKLVMTAMALALVGSVPVAYADHGAGGGASDDRSESNSSDGRDDRSGKLRHKVARIFNAMDTDGSDTITLDEWLVKTTAKAERQFDRIDSDDDSLISLEEFQAIGPDRNDDIDRDAVRACVADATGDDVPERPARDTAFDEIDTNDDGFIDLDEFLAVKTEGATNRFNHIDADGDGAITKQELAKALMQHREHRRAVRDCVEDQRETDELLG